MIQKRIGGDLLIQQEATCSPLELWFIRHIGVTVEIFATFFQEGVLPASSTRKKVYARTINQYVTAELLLANYKLGRIAYGFGTKIPQRRFLVMTNAGIANLLNIIEPIPFN